MHLDELKAIIADKQKDFVPNDVLQSFTLQCPACKRTMKLQTRATIQPKKCSCKACGYQIPYFHSAEGIHVIDVN